MLAYLNIDSECDDINIYNEQEEPEALYDFEMKFNRLILYPSFDSCFYTTKENVENFVNYSKNFLFF